MYFKKDRIKDLFEKVVLKTVTFNRHTLFYNNRMITDEQVLSMCGKDELLGYFYKNGWIKIDKHFKEIHPTGCRGYQLDLSLTYKGLWDYYLMFKH